VTTPYRTSINDSIENEKNECAIMMMMGEWNISRIVWE
jgi:hypothetical protein